MQLLIPKASCDLAKVITCVVQILKMPHKVCKLSQLKLHNAGQEAHVAISLLVALGAVKKVFWKAEGQTGYAAAFVLKNSAFENGLSEIKFANLIRDMAGLTLVDFKSGDLPKDLQPILDLGGTVPAVRVFL